MSKKRRWLWVLLFIFVALLLGGLATGWNVVLVRDYQHILSLAKKLSETGELSIPPAGLMFRMILGTLGFAATLAITILIFIKLLNEMRLNQQQSEFLATVSHELKTPIAAIELSSSLIHAGGLSDSEREKLWNSHHTELRRLREEVEALLEAARWQVKPASPKRISVEMESWILQSFDHWKLILGPNASLKREGESLTLKASVDLRTLNLIMDNLLSNARKFARGTPNVVIRTRSVQRSRWGKRWAPARRWQVQVEDRGWGFPPEDAQKIFHRFFRSRNPAPYAIPGTGLGLFLAKSASRANGLSLRGESLGFEKGAVFIIEGPEIFS